MQDYLARSVYAMVRPCQPGSRMKIAVVGAGYVGCVTAACLSRDGHAVVAVDTDPSKVQSLRDGICPVVEPGLQELVTKNVQEGRLRAKESSVGAFANVDAAIVCVSTPSMPDGSVDIRPMMRVFGVLAEAAEKFGSSPGARSLNDSSRHAPKGPRLTPYRAVRCGSESGVSGKRP
jgi:threonine dehydrogenase-like Zn-dependent dehydrogenase